MASTTTATTQIKTRILIISDTHGTVPLFISPTENEPASSGSGNAASPANTATTTSNAPYKADVVIHCGDLTQHSQIHEYRKTFAMLRALPAPLKLVIAGNHDLALDSKFCKTMEGFSDVADRVSTVISEAEQDGVRYLTEGVHAFDLSNGARLRVYASQYTPRFGGWAFQYTDGHNFAIPAGIDIAMTHGPPFKILDTAQISRRQPPKSAGCPHLFHAIRRAKPKIHCFGHIHEAWGSYLAKWTDGISSATNDGNSIDVSESRLIKTLWDPMPATQDTIEGQGNHVDLTSGQHRLEQGKQTLFVNAAIMSRRYTPSQHPWLVDVDLPKS